MVHLALERRLSWAPKNDTRFDVVRSALRNRLRRYCVDSMLFYFRKTEWKAPFWIDSKLSYACPSVSWLQCTYCECWIHALRHLWIIYRFVTPEDCHVRSCSLHIVSSNHSRCTRTTACRSSTTSSPNFPYPEIWPTSPVWNHENLVSGNCLARQTSRTAFRATVQRNAGAESVEGRALCRVSVMEVSHFYEQNNKMGSASIQYLSMQKWCIQPLPLIWISLSDFTSENTLTFFFIRWPNSA